MRVSAALPLLAVSAIAFALPARAQVQQGSQGAHRRELVGLVRDSAGAGIEGATIEVKGTSAGTNDKGTFRLWTDDIDTVTISIRRLGYAPVSAQIAARHGQWDTVVVEMERTSVQLAGVTVTGAATRRALGLRTFEERRANGHGIYVTRDDILARNTIHTSDVLRGRRGLQFVRLTGGNFGVRFVSYSVKGAIQGCVPLTWIDGQAAPGLEIDDIPATDIQAIELYDSFSTVPFEFTPPGRSIPCGTIVIWTRIPGST